jgi:hypothetical protein
MEHNLWASVASTIGKCSLGNLSFFGKNLFILKLLFILLDDFNVLVLKIIFLK